MATVGCGLWMSTATSTAGPAPSRTAANSSAMRSTRAGRLQPVAGAEMDLQAAEAPLLDQHARALGPDGRVVAALRARPAGRRDRAAPARHTCGSPPPVARYIWIAVAAGAAEHLVDRQAGRLAGEVPERDVDAADRAHRHRPALVADAASYIARHSCSMRSGSLAEQQRLQPPHLGDDALGVVLQVWLAQPDQPLVGVDLQPDPARRHLQDLQAGDLHGRSRSWRIWRGHDHVPATLASDSRGNSAHSRRRGTTLAY